MSSAALRLSLGSARAWTQLYTAGAHITPRDARRELIASDLWEHEADAMAEGQTPVSLAGDITGRAVRGIPADLAWRLNTGGIDMQSTFVIERTTGVAVLMLVLFMVLGGALGPGLSGDEPYFSSDFPAFTRGLTSFTWRLIFQAAFAVAVLPTAALLYLTFRPHVGRVALIGAASLVASSLTMFAAVVFGVQLTAHATTWRAGGDNPRDTVWFAARDAAAGLETLSIVAALFFLLSFIVFGAMIVQRAMLPRAIGLLALAGVVVTVAATAVFGWWGLMGGLAVVMLSIVVTGGWLVARGTSRPAGPTDA
jgi:hypothetical protein